MAGYLLDTNVVLRLFDRNAPEHDDCRGVVEKLRQDGHVLFLAPQVIYEFWVVSTRPPDQRKGFGWTVEQAKDAIDHLLAAFEFYPDKPEVFDKWREQCYSFSLNLKSPYNPFQKRLYESIRTLACNGQSWCARAFGCTNAALWRRLRRLRPPC